MCDKQSSCSRFSLLLSCAYLLARMYPREERPSAFSMLNAAAAILVNIKQTKVTCHLSIRPALPQGRTMILNLIFVSPSLSFLFLRFYVCSGLCWVILMVKCRRLQDVKCFWGANLRCMQSLDLVHMLGHVHINAMESRTHIWDGDGSGTQRWEEAVRIEFQTSM